MEACVPFKVLVIKLNMKSFGNTSSDSNFSKLLVKEPLILSNNLQQYPLLVLPCMMKT